jgi:hypothetical protein
VGRSRRSSTTRSFDLQTRAELLIPARARGNIRPESRGHAGLDPELTLGLEVYCQFWARDAAASFGSNRSNALRFRVAP